MHSLTAARFRAPMAGLGAVAYHPDLGYIDPQTSNVMTSADLASMVYEKQIELRSLLVGQRPRVLIVGSNKVHRNTLDAWREASGEGPLCVIRRGTEIGNIDARGAAENKITVDNTPGINSSYVAQHMMRVLELDKTYEGEKIAIVGVGEIGRSVATRALAAGMQVFLTSPSLVEPTMRTQRLAELGFLGNPNIFTGSLSQAMEGAKRVAISIPWHIGGSFNANLLEDHHMRSLAHGAIVSSVSNPDVFSRHARDWTDANMDNGRVFLRIDTGVQYAIAERRHVKNIVVAHDEAFADDRCQIELDIAVLTKAKQFMFRFRHGSVLRMADQATAGTEKLTAEIVHTQ